MAESEIEHASDTALMTAACRAIETDRAPGLLRGQFGERLAGARDMTITQSVPVLDLMCSVFSAWALTEKGWWAGK
jgi:O-methyltransferase involved in polyketide biosynthesis